MLRSRYPIGMVLAVAVSLCAAPVAGGNRVKVEFVKPLSGATPFTGGCGVPGEETPSSEAEPHLSTDPRDPAHLVAAWQQDRFAVDGGALSNLVASSRDGGRTWKNTRLPRVSRCTGGRDERTSDPWTSIGGDGRTYVSSLTFTETPAGLVGAAGPTALAASTSVDGGRTFSGPTSIVNESLYDDREAITADPKRPGHAYVAWVRRYGGLGESGIEYFARTTNGGRTFSTPAPIYAPPSGMLPDPTLINVLPDGTLLNTFVLANGTPLLPEGTPIVPWEVYSMRSTNLGRTWSAPVRIAVITDPFAPKHPETGAQVRAFPTISTDIAPDGTAYVAWNEIHSTTSSEILFARSSDGGRTWSAPTAVARLGTQAFVPALAVMRSGTVGVTWDDFRGDRLGDAALTTEVRFAHSHDRGATWDQSKVAGPFDMLTAPPTSSTEIAGRFVGDYQGLAPLASGFGALFAQAKPASTAGPSDVFFARIRLGPAPKMRLRVRPRRIPAFRRTRLRFRVSAVIDGRRQRVRGATIRFAGRRVRTNRRGRARLTVRPRRTGLRRPRVRKRGLRSGRARVRVLAIR